MVTPVVLIVILVVLALAMVVMLRGGDDADVPEAAVVTQLILLGTGFRT